MTRQDLVNRVQVELTAAFPGDQADYAASADDVIALSAAIDDAIEICLEEIGKELLDEEETKVP